MRVLETLYQFSNLTHVVKWRIGADRKIRFRQASKAIQRGQYFSDKNGVLASFIKQLTETALSTELDTHLADTVVSNRKNDKSSPPFKTSTGRIELDILRDCAGSFKPQLVKKRQSNVSDEIETKTLSMYGRGLSYSNISEHIHGVNCISVSKVATNTTIIETVKAWQQQPLGSPSPFVLKLLYLGTQNTSKKWTMLIHNWDFTLSQLAIFLKICLMERLIHGWHSKLAALNAAQILKQPL